MLISTLFFPCVDEARIRKWHHTLQRFAAENVDSKTGSEVAESIRPSWSWYTWKTTLRNENMLQRLDVFRQIKFLKLFIRLCEIEQPLSGTDWFGVFTRHPPPMAPRGVSCVVLWCFSAASYLPTSEWFSRAVYQMTLHLATPQEIKSGGRCCPQWTLLSWGYLDGRGCHPTTLHRSSLTSAAISYEWSKEWSGVFWQFWSQNEKLSKDFPIFLKCHFFFFSMSHQLTFGLWSAGSSSAVGWTGGWSHQWIWFGFRVVRLWRGVGGPTGAQWYVVCVVCLPFLFQNANTDKLTAKWDFSSILFVLFRLPTKSFAHGLDLIPDFNERIMKNESPSFCQLWQHVFHFLLTMDCFCTSKIQNRQSSFGLHMKLVLTTKKSLYRCADVHFCQQA